MTKFSLQDHSQTIREVSELSKKNISSIKINTSGESGFYAVDLTGTDATLTMNGFVNKQNVIGQFAIVSEGRKGVFEAVRDPLGIGKLFYTRLDNGELLFSSQWPKLLLHGRPIYAVPRGKQVRLSNDGERTFLEKLLGNKDPQKHLVPITMGRYETELFN